MQKSNNVALIRCRNYEKIALKRDVDRLCCSLKFKLRSGDRVLLKPNLVSASGHHGNAVTHPEVVAAVASWCVDHGARVSVGDSPAFGAATSVMQKFGFNEALKGLPVSLINFTNKKRVKTKSGFWPIVAAEIEEQDYLINLPKVKAHDQLRLTLAVKNYFGVVLSWRKAFAHMQHGNENFVRLLIDLLDVFPGGISIIDGICAMHRHGPVGGKPFELGLIGASTNPVALDTAIMAILGVNPEICPLWKESKVRGLKGCDIDELSFPLTAPSELVVQGFEVPDELSPIRFQVHSFAFNSIKKLFS